MSKRNIIKRDQALDLILSGVEQASDFIMQTMGPGGKLVGLASFDDVKKFKLTKDGASASKLIKNIGGPLESAGASLVVEASQKMLSNVGDGTTTVVAILQSLVKSSYNLIKGGYNPNVIKAALMQISEILEKEINQIKKSVNTDDNEVQKVAHVASNNEKSISLHLSELIKKLGKDFVILVEDSKTGNDEIILRDGFYFDKGPTSPYFFSKPEEQSRMKITLDDCFVLVIGEKFSNIRAFTDLINVVAPTGKPMLIVADDFDEEITSIFVTNKMKLSLNYVCVRAPLFGEKRQSFLEDLAIISGAKIINPSQLSEGQITAEALGRARKIVISRDTTTIIDGNGNEEDKNSRISVIKGLISNTTSTYDKEKLEERLARLQNGIGMFQVGGKTEIEISERKERVEDAIHACKNAINGGVVPGAGCEFLWTAHKINQLEANDEVSLVLKLLANSALEIVTKTIVLNTNKASPDVIISEIKNFIKKGESGFGFNGISGKVENLIESGVINPAKVSIEAVKIASSICCKFIDIGSIIFEEEDKSAIKTAARPMGF